MSSPPTSDQPAALIEGRRIYLGNLLYKVQPDEIGDMLKDNGFANVEKIHISIDPVSARNPGYCFVDFVETADAQRALSSLSVEIRGRPVKVGPCEPKRQHRTFWKGDQAPTFNRWGDWTGQRDSEGTGSRANNKRSNEQGPYGAIDHFDGVAATDGDGRRLYVGGLARMINQEHNDAEIREIFEGFNPKAIGKRITPPEDTKYIPGDHHYCFVDFETAEEAAAARRALDRSTRLGYRLRVKVARHIPEKLQHKVDRPTFEPAAKDNTVWSERPAREDEQPRGGRPRAVGSSSWRPRQTASDAVSSSRSDRPTRSFASENWRRKDPVQ